MMAIKDKDSEVWEVWIPLKYSKCSLEEEWAAWAAWAVWVEWEEEVKDLNLDLGDNVCLFF